MLVEPSHHTLFYPKHLPEDAGQKLPNFKQSHSSTFRSERRIPGSRLGREKNLFEAAHEFGMHK